MKLSAPQRRHAAAGRVLFVLALCALAGTGCKKNKGGDVKGTVTYHGKPVNGATLKFFPSFGPPQVVTVDQQGKFRGVGIPLGKAKVTVTGSKGDSGKGGKRGYDPAKVKDRPPSGMDMKPIPPTIDFPEKYKDVKTTDLTCTITDKKQTVEFVLKD
jgi:hypothetical protein